jgi:hypothetical protein
MFESPPNAFSFRTDPWSSDYGSAVEMGEADETTRPDVIEDIEKSDWTIAANVRQRSRPDRIVFVDGVQQIDAWGRVESDERSVEAALASIAVGAAVCAPGAARVEAESMSIERVLAVSGGVTTQAMVVRAGRLELKYEHESSPVAGRPGVANAIDTRRRQLERRLGDAIADRGGLVVLDGRLQFSPGRETQVVGLTKTLHEPYVCESSRRLLPKLQAGERSPLFRIDYHASALYSWFLRLPNTRPTHHALAGIVRLETPAGVGETAAIDLADLTASVLPAFASHPAHDPRAPQNLVPVGALEKNLRHRLGEPAFLRRAIESHLQRELAGAAT